MRPSNIVTEAGFQTRVRQWWDGVPFTTSAVVIVCGAIYLVCLLIGYDSFQEICFLPSAIVSHFQVYRIYTAILFHASLLHVMFNMMALVPLGSELERIMGSVRLLYIVLLLASCNAVLHLLIALVVSHNPFRPFPFLMNECAIGFSGVLFSMIVMETSLSGVQSRSVFGLFNVPAKWYAFILLVLFQLLMPNVSLLGHLCGILSGFAYTYGLLNFLIPGSSFYSSIERSSILSSFVGRAKFIMCSGGSTSGYIPSHSAETTSPSALFSGNGWRNLSSWLPRTETPPQSQPTEDHRFPGRARTLAPQSQTSSGYPDTNLQARLLDPEPFPDRSRPSPVERVSDRRSTGDNAVNVTPQVTSQQQNLVTSDEQTQNLLSMGFEKTQVEVALAAADGDVNVAIEILMSQQG